MMFYVHMYVAWVVFVASWRAVDSIPSESIVPVNGCGARFCLIRFMMGLRMHKGLALPL
jgi:hypothetical protein